MTIAVVLGHVTEGSSLIVLPIIVGQGNCQHDNLDRRRRGHATEKLQGIFIAIAPPEDFRGTPGSMLFPAGAAPGCSRRWIEKLRLPREPLVVQTVSIPLLDFPPQGPSTAVCGIPTAELQTRGLPLAFRRPCD
jgi:hypothetical protein